MAHAGQNALAGSGISRRDGSSQVASNGEGRRTTADLIRASRAAISQSFAVLANAPSLSMCEWPSDRWRISAGSVDAMVGQPTCDWMGTRTPTRLRFYFDVDDGQIERHDEVGIVLTSEDEVVRETKRLLIDLAYAALPEGRPRLFSARIRNMDGQTVYEGSMKLNPLKLNGR
jgi:hypothetical protein